ncbi:MAG: hypothetical protein GSR86_03820 [Desulfurococcales archaeon]|nr:hypothetical protein [Desulfurococcales archaeon]
MDLKRIATPAIVILVMALALVQWIPASGLEDGPVYEASIGNGSYTISKGVIIIATYAGGELDITLYNMTSKKMQTYMEPLKGATVRVLDVDYEDEVEVLLLMDLIVSRLLVIQYYRVGEGGVVKTAVKAVDVTSLNITTANIVSDKILIISGEDLLLADPGTDEVSSIYSLGNYTSLFIVDGANSTYIVQVSGNESIIYGIEGSTLASAVRLSGVVLDVEEEGLMLALLRDDISTIAVLAGNGLEEVLSVRGVVTALYRDASHVIFSLTIGNQTMLARYNESGDGIEVLKYVDAPLIDLYRHGPYIVYVTLDKRIIVDDYLKMSINAKPLYTGTTTSTDTNSAKTGTTSTTETTSTSTTGAVKDVEPLTSVGRILQVSSIILAILIIIIIYKLYLKGGRRHPG